MIKIYNTLLLQINEKILTNATEKWNKNLNKQFRKTEMHMIDKLEKTTCK